MRPYLLPVMLVLSIAAASPSSAQTAVPMEIGGELKLLPDMGDALDVQSAVVPHREAARQIIDRTLRTTYEHLDIDTDDFYCIIHVFKWGQEAEDGSQKADKQNWYLYRGGRGWAQRQFQGTRIAGSREVWLLFIHLNRSGTNIGYVPSYQVTATPKQATNVAALMQLAKLFPGASALPLDGKAFAASVTDGWGGEKITVIDDLPCDVSVTARITNDVVTMAEFTGEDGAVRQLKVSQRPVQTSTTIIGDPKVFDNEGEAWWDVSVGVPIKGVSDLHFAENSTQSTVQSVDRTALVALIQIYVPPVDLKSPRAYFIPRPLIGVGISSHPLDKILVGGAIGTPFANFFAAGAYTRVFDEHGTRTDERKWQFVSGISLPVIAITKLLQNQSKDQ